MIDQTRFCRWCGNTRADHVQARNPRARATAYPCWSGFSPNPRPSCRVCGSGFNPAKSGREDCCYRHRMDS